ncbi:CRISPR system precrRNA processing endoribonuclease RAMP protein Cas6 [Candidatus Nitrotoga sp. M5]|uniref:CRISPR system precrRNA processing endoribonuclease RAMP protein Cas6 n=1 Tax=Candidatus Nitrotoga sp. M5 TaxID=2890409 RepID=UPI001EF6DFC4|nr:CRISPR system precrRNA processing endoribonuclease RAMP protein Cas6 [Candidatus Nitrotoga sp. M5]CAH1388336.1 putative Cytosolic protein [Candidatus Nitrotoga sp. M5]
MTSIMNTVALRLVRLRFSARLLSEAVMPVHKGSLFHGVFGRVLRRDFPYLYSDLFGSEQADGDASPTIRPYILLAPLDELRTWETGHEFDFELTLFGKAVRHAQACCDALRLVGRDGLGEQRAKFIVYQVDHFTNVHGKDAVPDDKTRHAGFSHPNSLGVGEGTNESLRELCANEDWLNVWSDGMDTAWITPVDLCLDEADVPCAKLTLNLQTPLRLKHENRLVRHPPDFSLLISKLLARLNMLSQAQGNQPLVEGEVKTRLLQFASGIELSQSDTRWVDWNRYSSSQKTSMQFGGLMGTLEYIGDLAPFLPYLRMAELTHLGGKSTFGLGRMICQY